ncbi:protein ORF100 [Cyprinid herpesvirus 1]|uniref:Protein ORF100 n=1 Tax=Cyprinid herpesvirus 1 TaxID=317858 RepID=K7PC90_9VIRU|nr:protein ORF100 [Cyprinid herpesvirus 1]AFJ20397.1 protein ORF100 [Cyprinid herpesvirus 1]
MYPTDSVQIVSPGEGWWLDFSQNLWVKGPYVETRPVEMVLGPPQVEGNEVSVDLKDILDPSCKEVLSFTVKPVGCWAAWKKSNVDQSLFIWYRVKPPFSELPASAVYDHYYHYCPDNEEQITFGSVSDPPDLWYLLGVPERWLLQNPMVSGVFKAYIDSGSKLAPLLKLGDGFRTLDVLSTSQEATLSSYCDLACEVTVTLTTAFRKFDKHDSQSRAEAVNAGIWWLMLHLERCCSVSPQEILRLSHLLCVHAPKSEGELAADRELREKYWKNKPPHKEHQGVMGYRLGSVAALMYLQVQSRWPRDTIGWPARVFTPDNSEVTHRDARIKHSFDSKYWELVKATLAKTHCEADLSGLFKSLVCPLDISEYLKKPFRKPISHHMCL